MILDDSTLSHAPRDLIRAVSLQQVVEHTGPGKGVGYVQQDPHVFYMVVEAGPVDWKFTVEEAIGYP